MNRNVMIGGVAAVVVLLGTAGYLIFAGRGPGGGGEGAPAGELGPVTTNAVSVISEYTNNLSQDGKRLNLGFPAFELKAKAGETTSSVFSTTWRVKRPADERVVVATATLNGFMKSTGNPPVVAPAPAVPEAAAPAAAPADGAAAPAATPETAAPAAATPPADGAAATPAEAPAKPAPAAPAGPVAGDGIVRISVALGSEASITEWRDHTGTGLNRRLSKAVSYIAADKDLRDGGLVPVTVTVEVSGGTALETIAKLNSIDVQVLTESAQLPAPAAEAPAAPATDAPAAEAPAEMPAATPTPATDAPATAPATPPAATP
ncbi:MAG: hypothetical protein ACK5YG_06570 [Alphaproteobacteria bacterium]